VLRRRSPAVRGQRHRHLGPGREILSRRAPLDLEQLVDGVRVLAPAREIDVLGFSPGGFVAQEPVLGRPRLVRRLVLAGTGAQGGEDMHGFSDQMFVHANRDQPGAEDILALFFERSETSVAKGQEYLQRIFTRTDNRDTPATLEARDAQMDAITTWGIPDATRLGRLAGIAQPVLVANGDNDRMVPTKNSYLLAERAAAVP
jgi:pimeloyl-ACP methyl ester carboxylesterase